MQLQYVTSVVFSMNTVITIIIIECSAVWS